MLGGDASWIHIGGGISQILLGTVILILRPKLVKFVSSVTSEEYRTPRLTAGVKYGVVVVCVLQIIVGAIVLVVALSAEVPAPS